MARLARFRSAAGFTLIELLVVILIIGILIAVAAPSFLGQTQKAHDSATKQNLAIAYRAAKAYWAGNDGSFTGFDAAALQQSEPELTGHDGATCPTDAYNQPDSDIFIATASGGDLTLCADPSGRVWTLKVVDNGPVQITGPQTEGSGSGDTNPDIAFTGDAPVAGGPPNDNFSHAQKIDVFQDGSVDGTLVNATVQNGGDPLETSDLNSASLDSYLGPASQATASVWYYFTVPADGNYHFAVQGHDALDGSSWNASPALAVFDVGSTGGVNGDWSQALTSWGVLNFEVGDQNYSGLPGQPQLDVGLPRTEVLLVRVSNDTTDWDAGDVSTAPTLSPLTGSFTLSWTYTQLPPQQVNTLNLTSSGDLNDVQAGDVLTVDNNGAWSGDPSSFDYVWERCLGPGSSCVDISGETGQSYTVQAGDENDYLHAVVVAHNAGGDSGQIASTEVGPVAIANPAPPHKENADQVTISWSGGNTAPDSGQLLSVDIGTWTGHPTPSYSYTWQSSPNGSSWSDIAGAGDSSDYVTQSTDVGYQIRVVVQGTNQFGTDSANSVATDPVVGINGQTTAGPDLALVLPAGMFEYDHAAGSWHKVSTSSYVFFPAWSPDHSQLAFNQDGSLIMISTGGANGTLLYDGSVNDGISHINDIRWSPDGTKIAWTGSAAGVTRVGVIDSSTGALLYDQPAETYSPQTVSWASNSTVLFDATLAGVGGTHEIFSIPATGSAAPTQLTAGGDDYSPRVSPDGSTVLYYDGMQGYTCFMPTPGGSGPTGCFNVPALLGLGQTGVAWTSDSDHFYARVGNTLEYCQVSIIGCNQRGGAGAFDHAGQRRIPIAGDDSELMLSGGQLTQSSGAHNDDVDPFFQSNDIDWAYRR